jgi:hypothetical protein
MTWIPRNNGSHQCNTCAKLIHAPPTHQLPANTRHTCKCFPQPRTQAPIPIPPNPPKVNKCATFFLGVREPSSRFLTKHNSITNRSAAALLPPAKLQPPTNRVPYMPQLHVGSWVSPPGAATLVFKGAGYLLGSLRRASTTKNP